MLSLILETMNFEGKYVTVGVADQLELQLVLRLMFDDCLCWCVPCFWGHEGCLSRQSAHSNIGHGWIEISKSRITMDQKWSKVGCFQEQQKNIKQQSFIYIVLPSGKPTWQWKMNLLKMYSLLKMEIFLYQRVVLVDPVSLAFRILSLFFNTCHVHQKNMGDH